MFVTTSVCMEQRDQCQCPLWGGSAVNFDLWSGRDLERGGQINCQINITNFSYLIKLSSKYHSSLQLLINSRVGQDWIIFKCHKNFLFMKYFQCSIKIFSGRRWWWWTTATTTWRWSTATSWGRRGAAPTGPGTPPWSSGRSAPTSSTPATPC